MSIGSDTPRTDEIVAIASIEDRYVPLRNLARTLERDLARLTEENEALRKDAERLAALAWPEPFCDEFGGVDIYEEASIAASAFGRDEPTKDDYIAAVRTAIDAAIKEGS